MATHVFAYALIEQALKVAQDQLKVDQEKMAREQEELRVTTEAAQKDIADGDRVSALRASLEAKQVELDARESDAESQTTSMKKAWQRLHDRQEALSFELEITCGEERHDKAVLLKELRLTLTENAELSEKIATLERQALFWSDGQHNSAREAKHGTERDRPAPQDTSTSDSGSSEIALNALPRLPSLSLGMEQEDVAVGEEAVSCSASGAS